MMLKSQLQTTNFSKNFLYELPDEVLEMIYRQVFGGVMGQLDKMNKEVLYAYRSMPFTSITDIKHKRQSYLWANSIYRFQQNIKSVNTQIRCR